MTPLRQLLENQCELCYFGKGSFSFGDIDMMESKEFDFAYGWVLKQMQDKQRIMDQGE